MSKYTTELRFIAENYAGLTDSVGYSGIDAVLDVALPKIFDFDFPIFDESYRIILERKIVKHYYTREIAFETVGLWKLHLNTRLNEIMPFYNQLYRSELLEINPLYDTDLTTEYNRQGSTTGTESGTDGREKTFSRTETTDETIDVTTTGTESGGETVSHTGTVSDAGSTSSTRTDNLNRRSADSGSDTTEEESANKNTRYDLYSDTPQGALTGVDSEYYLTNARKITDDGSGSTQSSTTDYGKVTTTSDTGTQQTTGSDSATRTLNTQDGTTRTGSTSGQSDTDRDVTTTTSDTSHDVGNFSRSNQGSSTDAYIMRVHGKQGGASFVQLLQEYRKTFLNIDMMIIDELSDLFFGLW